MGLQCTFYLANPVRQLSGSPPIEVIPLSAGLQDAPCRSSLRLTCLARTPVLNGVLTCVFDCNRRRIIIRRQLFDAAPPVHDHDRGRGNDA